MSSSTRFLLSLGLVLGAASAGCSGETSSDDATGADDQAITGVTDLTEMESAFGLGKDFKNANGTWYRTDALLKNGPCYKKLIGGPDGASYIFRRYSTGASFFKKLGAGAASGDERPVVCVDIDVAGYDGTSTTTIEVNDFEIDGAIRYRWGKPSGGDGAAGSTYETFAGGDVHYINQFCYPSGNDFKFSPLSAAEFNNHCLAGASFPGSVSEIDGTALLLVYQYAYKNALKVTNRFSSQADAVGRFISVEGDWQSPVQHVRFEKLDLHIVRTTTGAQTSKQSFYLTPKGKDATIAQTAVASCADVGGPITCKGL